MSVHLNLYESRVSRLSLIFQHGYLLTASEVVAPNQAVAIVTYIQVKKPDEKVE